MSAKMSKELALHRLEQAKEDLKASKVLYKEKLYKSANSRAYYSVFHSIRSILSLEPIDFKRHKDVIAHFNQYYINKEIFQKQLGRRIAKCSKLREDSDYDDEFVVNPEVTQEQISTAEELLKVAEEYVKKRN